MLVLQAAHSANAFMRSAALDLPDRRFCVVEYEHLDAASLTLALAEFASLRTGYSELRLRGKRTERRAMHATRVHVDGQSCHLAPGSLLVVTGGASGIGRASAAAMARTFGCRLALIGRSGPGLESAQSALGQLRAERCEVQYFQADLSLPDQAAAVAASITETMGPVHAVLHAAGINHPVDVTRLAEDDLAATIACKITSLRNLLEHLDAQALQLVLGFGSIIGELGLAGEAHYALANEWLGLFMEEFARERPDCRTQLISWTAWGQTGMAARLEGVVDGLALQDSRAIDTEEGIAMLQQIVAGRCAPSVICSGRHGRRVSGAEQRMVQASRYLERLLVLYPKVELIADATISTDSDPYLRDHAPQGVILFPMACAIEAMLAAARVLAGIEQLPVLRNFSVGEGISLAAGQRIVVRTCALVRNDGAVEVQLRSDTTGYEIVHFSGVFSAPAALAVPVPLAAPFAKTRTAPERGALPSANDLLYRGLCFHGPRFQQLGDVVSLSATECRVWTGGKGEASWYSPFLPGGHTGGAPYIRDSVMHALQLCVPHEVVLPVGVDNVNLCRFDSHQTYLIAAHQRSSEGGRFVFDIDVFDQGERLVEWWRGLKLVCAPHAPTARRRPPIAPILLESIAGRLAMDELGAEPVQVRLYTGLARHAATAAARIDLAPSAAAECKQSLCTTHFDEYALVLASSADRVTLDVQLDPRFDLEQWRLILGDMRWQFSLKLAQKYSIAPDCAALCTWTLSECLVKLGVESWPFASAESTRRSTPAGGDMMHFSSAVAACVVMLVELAGKDAVAAMSLAVAPSLESRANTATQAQLVEEKV
ncbi:MAG: SDR family NAD(P)-dependent oxidoreductase [Telluria sp.]